MTIWRKTWLGTAVLSAADERVAKRLKIMNETKALFMEEACSRVRTLSNPYCPTSRARHKGRQGIRVSPRTVTFQPVRFANSGLPPLLFRGWGRAQGQSVAIAPELKAKGGNRTE